MMERIPIYLDSNVLIDIAEGREDELIGLLFRSIYFGPYCYPFSAEQISEIASIETKERNESRLMLLKDISKNVYFENSINNLGFRNENTQTVFNTINEVSTDSIEEVFNNFISYDQMKSARESLGLSSEILNNLSPKEAIDAIDSAFASFEYGEDFKPPAAPLTCIEDMIKYCEVIIDTHFPQNAQNPHLNPDSKRLNGRIVILFSLLDSFGFWSDKKETYKKGSRFADSRHTLNGSYFQKVVSRDKRFLKKAEAAYLYFNIETGVHTTEDFKNHLKTVLKEKS